MATNAIKRYLATHQSRVEKALGDAMAATLSEQPDDPLSFIANHLTSAPKSSSAADLIAGWAEGLPATRDLTDAGETARVLEIATEMIKSGLPIEDFKAACYGDAEGKGAGPTVLVSAVGSAESKLKMKTVGGFHLTCIFAMYGEQNRIQTKAGHKNGQDFIRMKVKQLDWLFEGEDASKSWEILAVDDGCPHDSKTLARKIISDEGYKNVSVLDLEDAVRDGVAFFAERGLKAGCKESRKGGAILYGLHTAASRAAAAGNAAVPALAMYTDSDLSTDMSLCGLLAAGVLAKDARMSMGARYGAPGTFLVKPPDFGPSGHPLSHFEQPNMMKIVFRHCAPPRNSSARNSAQFSEPHPSPPQTSACGCCRCSRACTTRSARSSASAAPTSSPSSPRCARSAPTSTWSCCSARSPSSRRSERGPTRFSATCRRRSSPRTSPSRTSWRAPTTRTSRTSRDSSTADRLTRTAPQLTIAHLPLLLPLRLYRYKTYAGMNQALVEMHKRYVAGDSADAAAAAPLVEFCSGLQWEGYKRMVLALEARLGPTLFDKDFTLDELKAAAAAE